jgi:hypothetical protein
MKVTGLSSKNPIVEAKIVCGEVCDYGWRTVQRIINSPREEINENRRNEDCISIEKAKENNIENESLKRRNIKHGYNGIEKNGEV